jgi:hypothetical protein
VTTAARRNARGEEAHGLGCRAVLASMLPAAVATFAFDASADPARAEQSFVTGVRMYDAKKYGQAADYFALAYVDEPRAKYLWNVAIAELQAERYLAAYKHFRLYKSLPDAAKAHLDVVDDLIHRAGIFLGHISIEAPPGYVIAVDGVMIGVAPLSEVVDVDAVTLYEHPVSADRGASHLKATVTLLDPGKTRSVWLHEPPTERSLSKAPTVLPSQP